MQQKWDERAHERLPAEAAHRAGDEGAGDPVRVVQRSAADRGLAEGPVAGYVGEIPDARAWQGRLMARRWLIGASAALFLALVLLGFLPILVAMLATGVMTLVAAFVPRRETLSRTIVLREPERKSLAGALDYQALVTAIPDPALMLDATGRVLVFNRQAAELLDGARAGVHLSSIVRSPMLLDAVASPPDPAQPRQVAIHMRVPVERHIAATLGRVQLGSPGPGAPALLLCLRDLTEQERLSQMRMDFIANASHELRTPLASMIGFIETLQGAAKNDPAARERFLTVMAKQAQRMKRLIDELLSLSRVEMRAHILPSDPVDLNEIVEQVTEALAPLAEEREQTLTVTPLDDRAIIRGDRDELLQVCQNLIDNAIKYGRRGGRVAVRLQRRPPSGRKLGRIALSVDDDGPGIAPEHLPRLTERFYRVDVSASRERGGTGLGLAIVKHVVNRHRGELQITSQPDSGSSFTIILPEWTGS